MIFLQYLELLVGLFQEVANNTKCMYNLGLLLLHWSTVTRGHLFLVLLNPLLSNDSQSCAILYGLDHVVHIVHQEEG